PSHWKKLERMDYELHYPEAWQFSESGEVDTRFILLAPNVLENDSFRENINLVVQDLSEINHEFDLTMYAEISKSQILSMVKNVQLIKAQYNERNGQRYYEICYAGDKEEFELKWLQYYWVIEQEAFVLTYTADQSDFDKFSTAAFKIMDAFKIIK
ncbi:MAG: hypothetical protein WD334_09205, partial [Chitinophagales bacterium]